MTGFSEYISFDPDVFTRAVNDHSSHAVGSREQRTTFYGDCEAFALLRNRIVQ